MTDLRAYALRSLLCDRQSHSIYTEILVKVEQVSEVMNYSKARKRRILHG